MRGPDTRVTLAWRNNLSTGQLESLGVIEADRTRRKEVALSPPKLVK